MGWDPRRSQVSGAGCSTESATLWRAQVTVVEESDDGCRLVDGPPADGRNCLRVAEGVDDDGGCIDAAERKVGGCHLRLEHPALVWLERVGVIRRRDAGLLRGDVDLEGVRGMAL